MLDFKIYNPSIEYYRAKSVSQLSKKLLYGCLVVPQFTYNQFYTNAAPGAAQANSTTGIFGKDEFGPALNLQVNRGAAYSAMQTGTNGNSTMLVGFKILPGSPSFVIIRGYYNGSRGEAAIALGYDSTNDSIYAYLGAGNFQSSHVWTIIPSNASNKFLSIAVAGNRTVSVIYAAINGVYLGSDVIAGSNMLNGSTLEFNRGSFNGGIFNVYYAGLANAVFPIPDLIELSKPWSVYTPKEKTLAVPTTYPTLSNLQAGRGNTSVNLSTSIKY